MFGYAWTQVPVNPHLPSLIVSLLVAPSCDEVVLNVSAGYNENDELYLHCLSQSPLRAFYFTYYFVLSPLPTLIPRHPTTFKNIVFVPSFNHWYIYSAHARNVLLVSRLHSEGE